MTFLSLWLNAGLVILVLMTLLWLLSLALMDSSIVDIFWGAGFVIAFWTTRLFAHGELGARLVVLGVLVSVWGLRLTLHILARNAGKGEDFRYAAWRREAGQSWWWLSLPKVFLLQGFLMWIIAMPLVAAQAGTASERLSGLDLAGTAMWLVGFVFEAGGDLQLSRFRADPANKGQLLTSGLWSVTRHPNYFGDAAQWWGFYLISAGAGGHWTVLSPALMTYLLARVSGVVMLEKTLKTSKPGYAEYVARTPAFIPWFRRKS